jgi:hypothetical protein
MAEATMEKVAASAVMAGCRPAYLPVVCAALTAMLDPRFALAAVQAAGAPLAPFLLVNGPVATALEVNGATGSFCPGWRANATIARAVGLILLNVGGATPSRSPRVTQGAPTFHGTCVAEHEAASPWAPLHASRGLDPHTSAVTVWAAESPVAVEGPVEGDGRAWLRTAGALAGALWASAASRQGGEALLVLAPDHAAGLARAGWARDDVRRAVLEDGERTLAALGRPDRGPRGWQDVAVAVVGGAGPWSSWVVTGAPSRSVTRVVAGSVA